MRKGYRFSSWYSDKAQAVQHSMVIWICKGYFWNSVPTLNSNLCHRSVSWVLLICFLLGIFMFGVWGGFGFSIFSLFVWFGFSLFGFYAGSFQKAHNVQIPKPGNTQTETSNRSVTGLYRHRVKNPIFLLKHNSNLILQGLQTSDVYAKENRFNSLLKFFV